MDTLKRIISTPNLVVTFAFLIFGIFSDKINIFYALAIIGFLLLFAVLNVGNKQLWK